MGNMLRKIDWLLLSVGLGAIVLFIIITLATPSGQHQISYQEQNFSNQVLAHLTSLSTTPQARETVDNIISHHNLNTSVLLYKSGVIHHSFHQAAMRAHLTHDMYSNFIHIFANRVNFRTDLHPGDRFSILYKGYYHQGHLQKHGPIIFAQLISHHKTHQAIYYKFGKYPHYYLPSGHLVTRTYLYAPLHYKRISGHFTYHRLDPVLHVVRPHLGIDYAAKWGTPIHSISDGEVIFKGKRGGYGNAVVVRYNRKYKALYGHMAHFARHLHNLEYVHKGQVLGYVGSTGWSTGPHLHFEMYVNGIPTNPATLKLPHDHPIPKKYLTRFQHKLHILLADLEFYKNPMLAENNNPKLPQHD